MNVAVAMCCASGQFVAEYAFQVCVAPAVNPLRLRFAVCCCAQVVVAGLVCLYHQSPLWLVMASVAVVSLWAVAASL